MGLLRLRGSFPASISPDQALRQCIELESNAVAKRRAHPARYTVQYSSCWNLAEVARQAGQRCWVRHPLPDNGPGLSYNAGRDDQAPDLRSGQLNTEDPS